jgi:hypothetical protein
VLDEELQVFQEFALLQLLLLQLQLSLLHVMLSVQQDPRRVRLQVQQRVLD